MRKNHKQSAIAQAVDVLSFLLGLAIGLAILGWSWLRLNARVKRWLPTLPTEDLSVSQGAISQLSRAIARQQQQTSQLERQIETWKQILQGAPVGYLQVDEENQLQWCNQPASQLLGMTLTPVVKPRLLIELVRSYELDELIEETRTAQQPCQKEWLFHPALAYAPAQKHPTHPHIALRGYGIPLAEGQVGVFLENRQEVVALSTQRDRAFSDVAHELKTPLTSIRLVAETLQTRVEPALKNWVDRLLNEILRLSNLVQVLLDLSQLEKGGAYSLNLKPLNLPDLIQSAWLSLEPLARQKQLNLDYQGPESLGIVADEHRLYRVFLNLLDNSIKYSPPQQTIWVKVNWQDTDGERQIRLEVIDAGSGFPNHAGDRVFERFYRVEPSRSRSIPGLAPTRLTPKLSESTAATGDQSPDLLLSHGSGLGLAIVRQIIEAHQGSVSASNHPDTGGAVVTVVLPEHPIEGVS